MLGASVFSVQDKFRVRIFAETLDKYRRFLPTGDRCEPLADAVFLYVGDQLDWDVELALPAGDVEPSRLGRFGQLGYTSWMAPNWAATRRDHAPRCPLPSGRAAAAEAGDCRSAPQHTGDDHGRHQP